MTDTTIAFEEALVDQHIEQVLRASGSSFRHYSMAKTREDMRNAMRAAFAVGASRASVATIHATGALGDATADVLKRLHEEVAGLVAWSDEDGILVIPKELVLNLISNKLLSATEGAVPAEVTA